MFSKIQFVIFILLGVIFVSIYGYTDQSEVMISNNKYVKINS